MFRRKGESQSDSLSTPSEWPEVLLHGAMKGWIIGDANPAEIDARCLVVTLGGPQDLRDRLKRKRPYKMCAVGTWADTSVAVARCPPGTLVLESLLAVISLTSVKNVVGLGTCGALRPEIQIGDIIIATSAGRGDGLTSYYYPAEVEALSAGSVQEALRQAARRLGVPARTGPIYTTASLLRQTRDRVQGWHDKGYLAVEGEGSALFLVGQHLGLSAGLILVVSDNPFTGQIGLTSREGAKALERGLETAGRLALDAATLLSGR